MEINVDTAAGLRMTGYGIISCQGKKSGLS